MIKKISLSELIQKKKQEALNRTKGIIDREAEVPAPLEALLLAKDTKVSNPTTPQNVEVKKRLSLSEIIALRKATKEKSHPSECSAIAQNKGNGLIPSTESQIDQTPLRTSPNGSAPVFEGENQGKQLENPILDQPKQSTIEAIAEVEAIPEQPTNETFSLDITLNPMQLLAKEMAFSGKSFCLVGAAGTGKTTAQREVARSLLQSGKLGTHDFRMQGTGQRVTCPSIAFVAYTRIASANLRRAIHKLPELEEALTHNVTTIHNLLEYFPETYWNAELNKESFRFTPKRTRSNPLTITHLVIEESSMVGLDLWEKLLDAIPYGTQIIFIGDINQLPPVFGDSILNYALVQLPVIELTQVYRQAGDSKILENAHRILNGETIIEAPDFKVITAGTINHTQARLAVTLGKTFPKWLDAGEYNPNEDIILCPWNKRDLGTDNMNKWIAQFLGTSRKAIVHHIIAGMTTLYLAIGDKVMYNKQVGVIQAINRNGNYLGKEPLNPSVNLNRFGTYTGEAEENLDELENIDYSGLDLDRMIASNSEVDAVKEASHHVIILLDDGIEVTLSAIGDYAASTFSLAYALTVHKAQGCEWRKVFFILHRDHAISLCREMFYTAVTRAREKLVIISKHEVIEKAIKTQKIKGNTIKDKIEYFNSGIKCNNTVRCTKG